ncbi:unnamed protein product [Mytilus coruscus]|uniref:Uncharacterized protein n=1 Tax=Mytilus coruscus TaxID=42192 RepID=A0A6J8C388_MYTCO|nr:unnamed protein product [Mytilus coruscus]
MYTLIHKLLDLKEVTIPVSSPIRINCDGDLRVNNIEVTIRRSNTTCMATFEDCTFPIQAIETIKKTCNKQVSCDVDIRNITKNYMYSCLQEFGYFNLWYTCKNIRNTTISLDALSSISCENGLRINIETIDIIRTSKKCTSREHQCSLIGDAVNVVKQQCDNEL